MIVFALGLCILSVAVATAIYDTWQKNRIVKELDNRQAPVPELLKAA